MNYFIGGNYFLYNLLHLRHVYTSSHRHTPDGQYVYVRTILDQKVPQSIDVGSSTFVLLQCLCIITIIDWKYVSEKL